MRRFWTVFFLLLVSLPAAAGEKWKDSLMEADVLNGAPLNLLRLDDAYRNRAAYAQGEDLMEEIIRFIFPISGRQQRPPFMPLPYWGPKKPQYKVFDWHKYESDHFLFYTYPEGETVLPDVVQYMEEEHEKNNRIFGVENRFTKKVPVIFYMGRRDFEQSSVIGGPVPESLGGLTEIFAWKRVTYPFQGDQAQLEHVVKHEGTHVYQIAKGARRLPLWFIEGCAETNSIKWDAQAELTLRDAYLNGFFFKIDDLWQVDGTWLMYKEGNFICNVLWDEYGEKGFRKVYDHSSSMSFEDNLKESLGMTIPDLDRKVSEALARQYGPILGQHDLLEGVKPLMEKRVLLRSWGRYFLAGGTSGPREAIFLAHVGPDGKVQTEKVIADRHYKSESLNFFQKGAWLDERRIAYAIRRSERDVIRVLTYDYDAKKKKFNLGSETEISPPGIDTLSDPVLTGETSIAFVGFEKGFSNLYGYDWKSARLEKLTQDNHHYSGLDYSPVRRELVFSREDGPTGERCRYDRNLYSWSLEKKLLTKLTDTPKVIETEPRFSPDGKSLLYVSDERGTYDFYSYHFDTAETRAVTRMRIGVQHPGWGDGGTLFLNSYEKTTPQIYFIPFPNLRDRLIADLPFKAFVSARIEGNAVALAAPPEKKEISSGKHEDGLAAFHDKGVVYWEGEPYEANAVAVFPDRVLASTRMGLPDSKKVESDERKHFFSISSAVESLDSTRFARRGVSEDLSTEFSPKLGGRAIVDAWKEPAGGQVLLLVNNRLASREKEFEKSPPLSLVFYDRTADRMVELKESPLQEITDRIQWVAFLKPSGILLAIGDRERGPFLLGVMDVTTGRFKSMDDMVPLFRVANDRGGFFWHQGRRVYMATAEEALAGKKRRLPKLAGSPVVGDYLLDGRLEFLTVRGKEWSAERFDAQGRQSERDILPHAKGEKLTQAAVDPETGAVAFGVRTKEGKQTVEELRTWDPTGRTVTPVPKKGVRFENPVYRKGALTFTCYEPAPKLPQEWAFRQGRLAPFERLRSARDAEGRSSVLEGEERLYVFDPENRRSTEVAGPVAGYATSGDVIVYSTKSGERLQLFSFDRRTGERKQLFKEDRDQIDPSLGKDKIAWSSHLEERWSVEEAPLNGGAPKIHKLKDYDLVSPKLEGDQITLKAYPSLQKPPYEAEGPFRPGFPRLLEPEAYRNEYRVQSLMAGAAYDGSSVRLLVTGYAENLFSDHGVFVNGVFLGDSQFASASYADLVNGRTYTLFYDFQDALRNGGINVSKSFILDRFREFVLFGEFEFQNYGLSAPDTAYYITPDVENRTFYVVKAGLAYAYDVTVWDSHGPVTGSRFYIQGSAGADPQHHSLANLDANLDYRLYTQVVGRFGFAHRIVAGTSQGDLPDVFLMGGNLSFRGVGFEELRGQNYWVFSEDMRIPLFDFLGAKLFDPLDQILGFFTRYFDVRGGIYTDVGQVWFNGKYAHPVYSVGYFVNVPTIFGLQFRFSQGFAGKTGFSFWAGVNW
ncbi:MAG: hypothetical protein V1798_00720 [Pseudomonadota bacterium]